MDLFNHIYIPYPLIVYIMIWYTMNPFISPSLPGRTLPRQIHCEIDLGATKVAEVSKEARPRWSNGKTPWTTCGKP